MGRESLRWRLSVERISVQLRQILFPSVKSFLLMLRRLIIQLAVMTGDAELLDQSQRGKQLRLIKHRFGEGLFIEQIEAPRPEPNQIDEKNHQRYDGNRNN